MSRTAPAARAGTVSRALARDRLGVPSVLAFVLASIAAMTVCAGVIPTAYQATGLTGIPFAFLAIAVILALFCPGYMAMSRRIRNAGSFYAFVTAGLGKVPGVGAALMALFAYESFQVAAYGALGVTAHGEAAAHLHLSWPWWAWALIFWLLVTVLGLARVEVAGLVLAVLTAAEIIIVVAETISGLARPAGGHLDFGALSPSTLTAAGAGTAGVLAVIALTGFVGFEQTCVLSEEARNPRRTIPAATYTAVAAAGLLYAAAAWAMEVHAGRAHVAAAAASQGPGLLYTLTSSSALAQTAQLLFMTSLFAAALSYHNVTWRYMFSLSREGVLFAFLSRTSRNSIPRAASITQSASGLVVIGLFAIFRWPPMTGLFYGGGATGGLGVMILLAITSAGIVRYLDRHPGEESVWTRMTAPALSALLLAGAVVLAIMHYGTLLGTAPGNPAAWLLPSAYGVAAAAGLAWGIILKARRPGVYATIGLGAHAVTGQAVPVSGGMLS
jgi:amino acid transporter